MVIPPEIIREEHPSYSRMFAGTVIIASVGGLLTQLLGPQLVHFLYRGKYDDGTFLIFWMAFAGALLVLDVLPRSYILAKLEWARLRPFILVQISVMLAVLLAGIWMVLRFELLGVALATTLTLLVRNILPYGYIAKLRWEPSTSGSSTSS